MPSGSRRNAYAHLRQRPVTLQDGRLLIPCRHPCVSIAHTVSSSARLQSGRKLFHADLHELPDQHPLGHQAALSIRMSPAQYSDY